MSPGTSWDDPLRKEPYQGVLFVSREAVASLTGSNGRNILDASLDGEEIRVTWMDGSRATLSWPTLRQRCALDRLRPPYLAFVSEGAAIGLLFTSRTPHEGLQLVEPPLAHRAGRLADRVRPGADAETDLVALRRRRGAVVEGYPVRFNTGSEERMSLEREKVDFQMTEQHPSRSCS